MRQWSHLQRLSILRIRSVIPILLLTGAVAVVATATLLVLWQIADRRTQARITVSEAKVLTDKLDAAALERQAMKQRIERLEAIASERPLHGGL